MKNLNVKKGSISILIAAGIVFILLLSLWPGVWATPSQEPLGQPTPIPKPVPPHARSRSWRDCVSAENPP